ncbi:MAG: hypothetical protein J1E83_11795 [Lachnospiraceae bacterium]|nr:hypothetical protein [Lachnospiraceae bacterium]
MDKGLIENWISSIIIGSVGVLFLIFTYAAVIKNRKEGRFISGCPLFGGVFIFIAAVISPCKWLCILCLLDYGVWMLPYSIYLNVMCGKHNSKSKLKTEDHDSDSKENSIL